MANQPVIAAGAPSPDLNELATFNAGYSPQAAVVAHRSQELAQALSAMRVQAQDDRAPYASVADPLAEALMQRKFGQPMPFSGEMTRADLQPTGLIPEPQADTAKGWEVNFEDLIPNQDSAWQPSSWGGGPVDLGRTFGNAIAGQAVQQSQTQPTSQNALSNSPLWQAGLSQYVAENTPQVDMNLPPLSLNGSGDGSAASVTKQQGASDDELNLEYPLGIRSTIPFARYLLDPAETGEGIMLAGSVAGDTTPSRGGQAPTYDYRQASNTGSTAEYTVTGSDGVSHDINIYEPASGYSVGVNERGAWAQKLGPGEPFGPGEGSNSALRPWADYIDDVQREAQQNQQTDQLIKSTIAFAKPGFVSYDDGSSCVIVPISHAQQYLTPAMRAGYDYEQNRLAQQQLALEQAGQAEADTFAGLANTASWLFAPDATAQQRQGWLDAGSVAGGLLALFSRQSSRGALSLLNVQEPWPWLPAGDVNVRSPNTAMRGLANESGTYVDPLTNTVEDAVGTLAADHFVPQSWTRARLGFGNLRSVDQNAILNMAENTLGLPQSFNSSKGALMPGDWMSYKGRPLDPVYIEQSAELARLLRAYIDLQIKLRQPK